MGSAGDTDRAASRRARVRLLVGRPGSWTRWIAGSAVWLAVWGAVFAYTRNGVALFLAILADLVTLLVRPHLIGDEDELNADLHRAAIRTVRDGAEPPEDPSLATDPADWFSHGDRHRFDGAPAPPSAEQPPEEANPPR